jgi:hypothetical protein
VKFGLREWENGIEALLALSTAHPAKRNLAVFLDNQQPLLATRDGIESARVSARAVRGCDSNFGPVAEASPI